jgi:hypothetical protein
MPAGDPTSSRTKKKSTDQVSELRDLIVGYAKQETIDPLSSLKRYLAMGIGGAVCVGVGSTFLILGLLRALQRIAWFNSPTQRDGWHGSWLVYVIALAAGLVLMGLAGLVALRSTRRKEAAR